MKHFRKHLAVTKICFATVNKEQCSKLFTIPRNKRCYRQKWIETPQKNEQTLMYKRSIHNLRYLSLFSFSGDSALKTRPYCFR